MNGVLIFAILFWIVGLGLGWFVAIPAWQECEDKKWDVLEAPESLAFFSGLVTILALLVAMGATYAYFFPNP